MSADKQDPYMPPKESTADDLYSLAQTVLSRFGCDGVLQALLATPFKRRQERWFHSLALTVRWLVKNGLTVESLQDNEAFIDTVMQASQAAMRTSQKEKLEALRGAIANSGSRAGGDAVRQAMFVNLVDTLTVWHLRLLKLLDDPERWFRENGIQPPSMTIAGSLWQMVHSAYQEMKAEKQLMEICLEDLQRCGLLQRFEFRGMMTGTGAYTPRTERLGKEFLAFVAVPPDLAKVIVEDGAA